MVAKDIPSFSRNFFEFSLQLILIKQGLILAKTGVENYCKSCRDLIKTIKAPRGGK
jgi:hypothetical protein